MPRRPISHGSIRRTGGRAYRREQRQLIPSSCSARTSLTTRSRPTSCATPTSNALATQGSNLLVVAPPEYQTFGILRRDRALLTSRLERCRIPRAHSDPGSFSGPRCLRPSLERPAARRPDGVRPAHHRYVPAGAADARRGPGRIAVPRAADAVELFLGMAIGQVQAACCPTPMGASRRSPSGRRCLSRHRYCALVPNIVGMIELRRGAGRLRRHGHRARRRARPGCWSRCGATVLGHDAGDGRRAHPLRCSSEAGVLSLTGGWRAIFLILAAFGASARARRAWSAGDVLALTACCAGAWRGSGRSPAKPERRFMGSSSTTDSGIAMATLYTYITASAHFFIGIYGMSPNAYAWLFLAQMRPA